MKDILWIYKHLLSEKVLRKEEEKKREHLKIEGRLAAAVLAAADIDGDDPQNEKKLFKLVALAVWSCFRLPEEKIEQRLAQFLADLLHVAPGDHTESIFQTALAVYRRNGPRGRRDLAARIELLQKKDREKEAYRKHSEK